MFTFNRPNIRIEVRVHCRREPSSYPSPRGRRNSVICWFLSGGRTLYRLSHTKTPRKRTGEASWGASRVGESVNNERIVTVSNRRHSGLDAILFALLQEHPTN